MLTITKLKLRRDELCLAFEKALIQSDYLAIHVSKDGPLNSDVYRVTTSGQNEKIIYLKIRNISDGGWYWKPEVYRIQMPAFSYKIIPPISENEAFLAVGVIQVDGHPIFVLWNIFLYSSHKTNCSLYVHDQSLIQGFNDGFARLVDSGKTIFIASEEKLAFAIEQFINYAKTV